MSFDELDGLIKEDEKILLEYESLILKYTEKIGKMPDGEHKTSSNMLIEKLKILKQKSKLRIEEGKKVLRESEESGGYFSGGFNRPRRRRKRSENKKKAIKNKQRKNLTRNKR